MMLNNIKYSNAGAANYTAYTGMPIIQDVMDYVGLAKSADHYLPASQSNRGYQPSKILAQRMYLLISGQAHASDLNHLAKDGLFSSSDVISDDTLLRHIKKWGRYQSIGALDRVHQALLEHCLLQMFYRRLVYEKLAP